MGYYIELKNISIDQYKKTLKNITLIPSWKILENNIDKNLDAIKNCNIKNLDELLIILKNKDKIQKLSKESNLSIEYLSVLKRVLNGYKQKPNKIKDFSCVPEHICQKLEELGINNTLKLYDKIHTIEKRNEFSKKTGISQNELLKLTKLTDLSRIRWVNHTFANVLLESGYDTVEKVSKANYQKLYTMIKQLNEEKALYNAHIGERDMKMVIESAQELDFEVEY